MSTIRITNSHYPSYDVMKLADEWDSHTKEIVRKRLGPFPEPEIFSDKEARYVAIIAGHIVYEDREDIITWIVHHLDKKLQTDIGEGERKRNIPAEKTLVREGLRALDHLSKLSFGKDFGELEDQDQFDILASLQQGQAAQIPEWSFIPQKDLFKKLASEIVSAYYSHPAVWSEIGYGGPMYPRIYVRIERGLTDPWEAKRNGK